MAITPLASSRAPQASFQSEARVSADFLQMHEQRLACIRNESLTANNPVRISAADLDASWADANIMNGSVGVMSGQLDFSSGAPSEAQLKNWAGLMLKDAVQEIDNSALTAAPKVTAGEANDKAIQKAATQVGAEGFVLTNSPANIAPVTTEISASIRALGDRADLRMYRAQGTTGIEDSPETPRGDDQWKAGVHLFVNQRTGQFMGFFSREGWV
jgi:hypothetical protein